MNKQQFLSALRATKKDFSWRIFNGKICGKIKNDSKLRGKLNNFCPITAVCLLKTKVEFNLMDYKLAADLLGLDNELAQLIVFCSDDVIEDPFKKELKEICK